MTYLLFFETLYIMYREKECVVCHDKTLGYINCAIDCATFCILCYELLPKCNVCAKIYCNFCNRGLLFSVDCAHTYCSDHINRVILNKCSVCAGTNRCDVEYMHNDIKRMRDCRRIDIARLDILNESVSNKQTVEFYNAGFLSTVIVAYVPGLDLWYTLTPMRLWEKVIMSRRIAMYNAARDMLIISGINHIWTICAMFYQKLPRELLYHIGKILTSVYMMPGKEPRII